MNKNFLNKIAPPNPAPDEPIMAFVPDRYYLGMFYLDVRPNEAFRFGGNITFQIWRFAAQPTHWHCTYRFRYYVDDSGHPEAPDRRSWWHMEMDGDEASIQQKFQTALHAFSSKTCTTASAFYIRGDCNKASDRLQNDPPSWLHMTMMKTE